MPATRGLPILMFIVLLLAVTGCGASALAPAADAGDSAKLWQSWDPLAAPVITGSVAQGLSSATAAQLGGRSVVALDSLNRPDPAVQSALELRQTMSGLEIWATRPLPSVALYVTYDALREHPVVLDVERPGAVSLALTAEPGLIAIGVAGIREALLDPSRPLAVLSFAPGADTAVVKQASITQDARSKIKDLTAVNNGDGSATLQWSERHTGDYDLNGLVGIPDLVRVGQYFNTVFDETTANWAQLEVVDGDNDSRIALPDLVPIAINFGSRIMGYNVYRTPLASASEIPDVNDAGRWTKVPNAAEPSGPSAPRDYSGQNFRLVYTFIDDSGEGDFGWYVAPAGLATDTPPQGPKSDPATLTVIVLPTAGFSFEIQPPAGSTVNVNDEFYLAVKVSGVTGLFSANVRFEYDPALVQYLEGVASYTGSPANFLIPPLFLAHDYGAAGAGGYNLLGFNATQTQGEPGKDGAGYLGFFKFKALAVGANTECFRFPQVSTYIYLWGTQYGVPIATPGLGAPQNLVIQ